MPDEDELPEIEVELAPEYDDGMGDASYAQTLSNSITALTQWEQGNLSERDFVKISIKRLLDAQIDLKRRFIDS